MIITIKYLDQYLPFDIIEIISKKVFFNYINIVNKIKKNNCICYKCLKYKHPLTNSYINTYL